MLDYLHNVCLKHFSYYGELNDIWSKMYICLHVEYPLFLSEFKETLIFWQIFEKYSDKKDPDGLLKICLNLSITSKAL